MAYWYFSDFLHPGFATSSKTVNWSGSQSLTKVDPLIYCQRHDLDPDKQIVFAFLTMLLNVKQSNFNGANTGTVPISFTHTVFELPGAWVGPRWRGRRRGVRHRRQSQPCTCQTRCQPPAQQPRRHTFCKNRTIRIRNKRSKFLIKGTMKSKKE